LWPLEICCLTYRFDGSGQRKAEVALEHRVAANQLPDIFCREHQADEILVGGDIEHGRFIL